MANETSKLILKPVTELLGDKFSIPSYQRGYRWTERQVNNLLDDIWEFRLSSQEASKDAFYCLQPVVVSKKNDEWDILDGQQRLTTIYIVLEYLKSGLEFLGKENFSIKYQTRPDSENFLQNIDLEKSDDNIDYYHICDAYRTVQTWFSKRDGNTKINFLTTLLNDDESGKNVKVIWYDVSDENTSETFAIDIFTRLNIGKIPLTNAELVKALFLQKGNFSEEKASLKQLQIASEWDTIERTLQNDAFWYFIYNPRNPLKYDNRIEYIFDLMKGKTKKEEERFTFYRFYDAFTESKKTNNGKPNIDSLWLDIKRYFLSFEEWFNDKELYHLIGYLVEFNSNVDTIKNASKGSTKTAFKTYLKQQIESKVNCQIDDLSYDKKKYIKEVLLLFNIQTILATENADIRFPFFRFKDEKWDIEHIRSQTDKQVTKENRRPWAIDVLEYFTGSRAVESKEDLDKQKILISELENITKDDNENVTDLSTRLLAVVTAHEIQDSTFENLHKDIAIHFKEDKDFEDKDGIGNLALLDSATNRSYGNAMFPIKRKTIIHSDMNGVFVPICTKNAFLKSYSKRLGAVMYWTENDAKDYRSAIKQLLIDYLPPQVTSNGN